MIIPSNSKVLFIAAHTDDVELAAGATLSKCMRIGADVHYLALTSTDNHAELLPEAKKSMGIFGIKENNYKFLSFPDMRFGEVRQEILQCLDEIRDELNPDVVFCPSIHDLHQDHFTAAKETMRSFKWSADLILGYDICWNMVAENFDPSLYVVITEVDVKRKLEAIRCYKSQKFKEYMDEEFIMAQMRFRGGIMGVRWAEAFEVYRAVWKS